MIWNKIGRVYSPDKTKWWSQYYGIMPTPIYDETENTLRVYFSTADKDKQSRIFSISLNPNKPTEILDFNEKVLLDLGKIGHFDDCGVVPSTIFKHKEELYLFYVGFQRSYKVPYMMLTGLARWDLLKGEFERVQKCPIMERTDLEPCIRSAPTILSDGTLHRMWYVSASHWELMNNQVFENKLMPNYVIRYTESTRLENWPSENRIAIDWHDDSEFGFGRPWVVQNGNTFHMWYSIRSRTKSYRIGYATSNDGIHWERKDNEVGITISNSGWDSEMICYPAVIKIKEKVYMFYNGNNNGETGFGVAELAGVL